MGKRSIAAKTVERQRFILTKRKPYQTSRGNLPQKRTSGKFSTKAQLLFVKATPKYSKLTPAQEKIRDAGKTCAIILKGEKDYVKRTAKAAMCIKYVFGKEIPRELEERAGMTVSDLEKALGKK